MPFLLIYIIKFSISLAVVFLFYQLVLRKLTFYNWNRIYLLSYTLFSFVVPFIDISGSLYQNKLAESEMINWLPIFQLKESAAINESSFTAWNIISLFLVGRNYFYDDSPACSACFFSTNEEEGYAGFKSGLESLSGR
ncbi:MAG: hypothetical protein IPI78_15105 [Chitinophagaceae bacterium]|nr:hypothetical protein [Chitinophagaceae bacterium]